jgi:hypothetical protein
MSLMNIAEQRPQWRGNYDIGYIGFTITKASFIAAGISWFTKWDALPNLPKPTHCFIVTGEDETVEAFSKGVDRGTLSSKLADENVGVLIRRPRHYSRDMGARLAMESGKYVGEKYGYWLVATLAVSNSIIGRLFSTLTGGWFERFVTSLGDKKKEQMCSELCARTMQTEPELAKLGVLQQEARTIVPVELFTDPYCFEPPEYAVKLTK